MAAAPPVSSDHVFVNCPFDDEYTETFRALIFAIRACGFQPRSARELDDGEQPRIEKLYGLIKECRYGIHDLLSRASSGDVVRRVVAIVDELPISLRPDDGTTRCIVGRR